LTSAVARSGVLCRGLPAEERRTNHEDDGASVEEWLFRNRRKMITCPYQPGNLRITLWGCKRRQWQARRLDLSDISKGDYFDYVYKKGLLRCRDCLIAAASPHRAPDTRSLAAGPVAA
jgi:hypothetical protein